LAAGGLAARPGEFVARPAAQVVRAPAADAWEPILPQGLAKSRLVAWLLSIGRAPTARARNRWSWLMSARIAEAVFFCTVASIGLTLALYWGKSQAAMVDGEIAGTLHATQDAKAATYLLRAEWASLNDPERLAPLAQHHLALQKVDPSQFAELDKLADRLDHPPPPPVQAAPDPTPEPPADSVVAEADEASGSAAAPEHRRAPVPTVSADTRIFRVAVRTPAAPRSAGSPAAHADAASQSVRHAAVARSELPHWLTGEPAFHPAPRVMSEPPHTLSLPANLPLAAPQPSSAARYNTMAGQLPPLRNPSVMAAMPRYYTAVPYGTPPYQHGDAGQSARSYAPSYAAPYASNGGGSALGGRAALPPPQPMSPTYYQ
jgi:hypothetical protein